jgi:hypothetical protein
MPVWQCEGRVSDVGKRIAPQPNAMGGLPSLLFCKNVVIKMLVRGYATLLVGRGRACAVQGGVQAWVRVRVLARVC